MLSLLKYNRPNGHRSRHQQYRAQNQKTWRLEPNARDVELILLRNAKASSAISPEAGRVYFMRILLGPECHCIEPVDIEKE
jgi:hypothetical protein